MNKVFLVALVFTLINGSVLAFGSDDLPDSQGCLVPYQMEVVRLGLTVNQNEMRLRDLELSQQRGGETILVDRSHADDGTAWTTAATVIVCPTMIIPGFGLFGAAGCAIAVGTDAHALHSAYKTDQSGDPSNTYTAKKFIPTDPSVYQEYVTALDKANEPRKDSWETEKRIYYLLREAQDWQDGIYTVAFAKAVTSDSQVSKKTRKAIGNILKAANEKKVFCPDSKEDINFQTQPVLSSEADIENYVINALHTEPR